MRPLQFSSAFPLATLFEFRPHVRQPSFHFTLKAGDSVPALIFRFWWRFLCHPELLVVSELEAFAIID
jgi:hypothetical protein